MLENLTLNDFWSLGMPLSSYNRVTSIISCKPSERQQHRLCHTDVGQSIIYKCLLPEHIYTFSLCWVEVNWGASCSLAGSLSQSNYLTLASREALLSCAVCQCVALHSISFYCTAFPCNALQYECSFTHCGAAGVHWWARGMGRHMVDKTWPGVRSSAAGAGGAAGAWGAAAGAGGKMKDDSLVPSGLLLPQSMDVHCQATIYPLFNAASRCVSS